MRPRRTAKLHGGRWRVGRAPGLRPDLNQLLRRRVLARNFSSQMVPPRASVRRCSRAASTYGHNALAGTGEYECNRG